MHELALARSLVEMVEEYALEHNARHVEQVNLRLGEMSALSRALHFCFGAVSQGTCCEGANLSIEEVPLTVYCHHCDEVKQPSGRYSFRCSDCGMPTPKIVTGKEMQLVSIKLSSPHSSKTEGQRENLQATRNSNRLFEDALTTQSDWSYP